MALRPETVNAANSIGATLTNMIQGLKALKEKKKFEQMVKDAAQPTQVNFPGARLQPPPPPSPVLGQFQGGPGQSTPFGFNPSGAGGMPGQGIGVQPSSVPMPGSTPAPNLPPSSIQVMPSFEMFLQRAFKDNPAGALGLAGMPGVERFMPKEDKVIGMSGNEGAYNVTQKRWDLQPPPEKAKEPTWKTAGQDDDIWIDGKLVKKGSRAPQQGQQPIIKTLNVNGKPVPARFDERKNQWIETTGTGKVIKNPVEWRDPKAGNPEEPEFGDNGEDMVTSPDYKVFKDEYEPYGWTWDAFRAAKAKKVVK